MPTDRISSSSSMIETMRAIARDKTASMEHTGKAAPANTANTKTGTADYAQRVGELRQRLRTLAIRIDVKSTQSLADAREPVVREILLWEFGSDFRKDPQFLPMIDAISHALDADQGYQQRFAELITGLRSG